MNENELKTQSSFGSVDAIGQSKILIVEDSPVEAEILRRTIAGVGYTVSMADNGKEGLQAVRARRPALVLSDINMPVMDGFQLCRALKYDDELWNIPLILLTVLSEPTDIIEAINSGADAYIVKPFVETTLLNRIRSLLDAPIVRPRKQERRHYTVSYAGKRLVIAGNGQQILSLLLSVYENTLNQNREMEATQNQLRLLNESLDRQVLARTAALRESEEFKSAIINSSNDCIKILSTDGLLKYMSDGGLRLLEIEDVNKYLGKSFLDFWNVKDRKVVQEAIANAAQGGTGRFQGYSPSEKGTPKWWDVIISPIRETDGAISKLLAVSRDITEHRQVESRLNEQLDELQRWQEASMGRELRTVELKREVNELLVQAGQPPRYPSVTADETGVCPKWIDLP
ncbi:MAG: response regulator [Candidatus Thiodiazotropha sp.]